MVSSAVKRARKKKLAHERLDRESFRPAHQMDPADITNPEIIQADDEVRFAPRGQSVEQMPATPATVQTTTGCEYADIVNMIKTLNGAIAAIARDTASIQKAYQQLRSENVARDKTLTDLSEIVREYGLSPTDRRPQPVLREDVLNGEGNLRAADIGIAWEDNETFLHGVRVVGPGPSGRPGMRPAMSTPHQPMGGRHRDDSPSTSHQQTRPLMSTPYLPTLGQDRDDSPSTVHQQTRPVMSTPYRPTLGQDRDLGPSSVRPVIPEVDYQTRRPPTETRQGYRPAAPIQRFNNKSLNWPAWFRHFRAVADVHGWNKDQRALQLVSYLDETAMNVVGHRARYAAGDRIGRPVSGLVGYNNGPAHRGGYFTDIGSGTLVPRGMDRRPRSGFPGGFRIGSYGTIMQILPDTAEGGSTGGSVAADGQKTARCQWIADHDFGMLVLHDVIFGSPDGISSFGV